MSYAFLLQFKKMTQCLFHCTWGTIQFPFLGLQKPSKSVFSTCAGSLSTPTTCPITPNLELSPNTTVPPSSHLSSHCVCLLQQPLARAPAYISAQRRTTCVQDSTEVQPRLEAITEPLTVAWAKAQHVYILVHILKSQYSSQHIVILSFIHKKSMFRLKYKLWGHWATVSVSTLPAV